MVLALIADWLVGQFKLTPGIGRRWNYLARETQDFAAVLCLWIIGKCRVAFAGSEIAQYKVRCFWLAQYKIDIAAGGPDLGEKILTHLIRLRDDRKRVYHKGLLLVYMEESFQLPIREFLGIFKEFRAQVIIELIELFGFNAEMAYLPTVLGRAVLRYEQEGVLCLCPGDAPPPYEPRESGGLNPQL